MDPNAPSVAIDTAVREIVKVSGSSETLTAANMAPVPCRDSPYATVRRRAAVYTPYMLTGDYRARPEVAAYSHMPNGSLME